MKKKKLCKINQKERAERRKDYAKLVKKAKVYCDKCGRASRSEKNTCTPVLLCSI